MVRLSTKYGGGRIYNPPRMLFDGSTGYYSASYTSSGNAETHVALFRREAFPTGSAEWIGGTRGLSQIRCQLAIVAEDAATVDERGRAVFFAVNSGGTQVCRLISDIVVTDNEWHTIWCAYDAIAGTAIMIIDGKNADNLAASSRVLTTGTLDSGASSTVAIGYQPSGVGDKYFTGSIGFAGVKESYDIVWQNSIDQYGNPKQTDFSTWLFGHFAGKMDESVGTAGVMTKNGTITLVDSGPSPQLGLPTVGDAENWHLKSAKRAWVNGTELVGSAYTPAMMKFNGSTGYYIKTGTTITSSTKRTAVGIFKHAPFAGTNVRKTIFRIIKTYVDIQLEVYSDTGSSANKIRFYLSDNTGVNICQAYSSIELVDGNKHAFLFEYDGATGTAKLLVDNIDVLDASPLTTGTMQSGSGFILTVGATQVPDQFYADELGFLGITDNAGYAWGDFFHPDGSPKNIIAATAFGGTPLFWNPHCDMVNNLGSAGSMTKNGEINVGNGGST